MNRFLRNLSDKKLAVRICISVVAATIFTFALVAPLSYEGDLLQATIAQSGRLTIAVTAIVSFAATFGCISSKSARVEKPTAALAVIFSMMWLAGRVAPGVHVGIAAFSLAASAVYFVICICCLDLALDWISSQQKLDRGEHGRFHRGRAFAVIWLIVVACWVPYVIALYPGCIAPNDTLDQLQQFFGIESFTSTMTGQVSDGMFVNNHHPALHTMLLGLFCQLGFALGDANTGLFLLVLVQVLLASSGLAFGFSLLYANGLPKWAVALLMVLPCLAPMMPILMCNYSKDALFTALFIWFVALEINDTLSRKVKRPTGNRMAIRIFAGLSLLLCCLLRSSMLYITAVVIALLVIASIRRRSIRSPHIIAGFLAAILVMHGIYPLAGVTPGNPDEKWALVLQQIALCYIEHGDEMDAAQVAEIDRVLETETLADRFASRNADPVKNTRSHNLDTRVDGRTLAVWIDCLARYPKTCLLEWAFCVADYYYPYTKQHFLWTHTLGYTAGDKFIDESARYAELGIGLQEGGIGIQARSELESELNTTLENPLFFPFSMGTVSWASIYAFYRCLARKRYDLLIPSGTVLLLCMTFVISPAAGLVRYVLPLYGTAPLVIGALGTQARPLDTSAER